MKKKRTVLLGIDPSFITMGVAIRDPKKNTLKLFTGTMRECLKWISKNCKLAEVVAVVENPALDSAVFGAWNEMKKAIFQHKMGKMSLGAIASVHAIGLKRAQHVGENKAAAKEFIKMLHEKNVPTLEIAPSKRQKAFKNVIEKGKKKVKRIDVRFLNYPTKCTRQQFAEFSKFAIKGTEHSYDAATLIVKETVNGVLTLIRIQEEKNKPSTYPKTANDNFFLVNRKTKVS